MQGSSRKLFSSGFLPLRILSVRIGHVGHKDPRGPHQRLGGAGSPSERMCACVCRSAGLGRSCASCPVSPVFFRSFRSYGSCRPCRPAGLRVCAGARLRLRVCVSERGGTRVHARSRSLRRSRQNPGVRHSCIPGRRPNYLSFRVEDLDKLEFGKWQGRRLPCGLPELVHLRARPLRLLPPRERVTAGGLCPEGGDFGRDGQDP